jgi:hypothetical protein
MYVSREVCEASDVFVDVIVSYLFYVLLSLVLVNCCAKRYYVLVLYSTVVSFHTLRKRGVQCITFMVSDLLSRYFAIF